LSAHDLVFDGFMFVLGVASTYLLSLRPSARQRRDVGDIRTTHRVLLVFSLALWCDGLLMAVFVELQKRHWWVVVIVWIAVNFAMLALLAKRKWSQ